MAEHDDKQTEAARILARVERENAGGGLLSSGLGPSKVATPAAEEDWIEYWGTRLGRMIGIAAATALAIWLVLYAMNVV